MPSRLGIAVLFALTLPACATQKRALEIVGCDPAAAPYVTQWSGELTGLAPYVFVKLNTHDAMSTAQVSLGCAAHAGEFEHAPYPVRDIRVRPPLWWALHRGDTVEFAELSRAGRVFGVIYRRATSSDVEWFMFADGH